MDKIQMLRWRPWLMILGLAFSLVMIGIFASRALRHMPRPQVDEPIHAWMNVPFKRF